MPNLATNTQVDQKVRQGDKALTPEQVDLDRLVAAFVRTRGADNLEGAILTRHWLAVDMGVPVENLDGILKLLRWQGLVALPNEHLVMVEDAGAMRALALDQSDNGTNSDAAKEESVTAQRGFTIKTPFVRQKRVWH